MQQVIAGTGGELTPGTVLGRSQVVRFRQRMLVTLVNDVMGTVPLSKAVSGFQFQSFPPRQPSRTCSVRSRYARVLVESLLHEYGQVVRKEEDLS